MKNKIAKLINVKSIITLILCAVFAYLAVNGIRVSFSAITL